MQQNLSDPCFFAVNPDYLENLSVVTSGDKAMLSGNLDIGLLPMDQMWKLMQLYTPPSTRMVAHGAHQSTEPKGMETSPVTT
jgi:hypothetical protein